MKPPPQYQLSEEQAGAVTSDAQAIAVVSGAGTGKTEVVARRIERLLRESSLDDFRIVALSYTVKAADELKDRLESRLGDLHRRVDTDTVHGFALSLLRLYGTRIGLPVEPEILTRDEDRAELLAAWLRDAGRRAPADLQSTLKQLDLARARCEDSSLLEEWRSALAANGSLDYPAMLEKAIELTESPWVIRQLRRTYRHLIVDEAQNLTRSQYAFIVGIIGSQGVQHISAVFVGDEKQSIVGFAGADHALFAKFAEDYKAQRIELHKNYRSAATIVRLGEEVATELQHQTRTDATIYPAQGSIDTQILSNEEDEGEYIAQWARSLLDEGPPKAALAPGETISIRPEEIAVLSRSAASLRFARNALEAAEIRTASASTEEDWVRSPMAKIALELVAHQSAPAHASTHRRLSRLLGGGNVGSSRTDLAALMGSHSDPDIQKLRVLCIETTLAPFVAALANLDSDDQDWTDDLAQITSAWQTFQERTVRSELTFGNFKQYIARIQKGDNLAPGVRLLTVHKAQGREFRAVAIVACNEGQLPDFRATTSEEKIAERRIFYVAVTRASRVLLLTRASSRSTQYGERSTEPSSYLRYVEEARVEKPNSARSASVASQAGR